MWLYDGFGCDCGRYCCFDWVCGRHSYCGGCDGFGWPCDDGNCSINFNISDRSNGKDYETCDFFVVAWIELSVLQEVLF